MNQREGSRGVQQPWGSKRTVPWASYPVLASGGGLGSVAGKKPVLRKASTAQLSGRQATP